MTLQIGKQGIMVSYCCVTTQKLGGLIQEPFAMFHVGALLVYTGIGILHAYVFTQLILAALS